jgi:hypothetical protein
MWRRLPVGARWPLLVESDISGGIFPFGPTLAAIIVTALVLGRPGLRELWDRQIRRPPRRRWYCSSKQKRRRGPCTETADCSTTREASQNGGAVRARNRGSLQAAGVSCME